MGMMFRRLDELEMQIKLLPSTLAGVTTPTRTTTPTRATPELERRRLCLADLLPAPTSLARHLTPLCSSDHRPDEPPDAGISFVLNPMAPEFSPSVPKRGGVGRDPARRDPQEQAPPRWEHLPSVGSWLLPRSAQLPAPSLPTRTSAARGRSSSSRASSSSSGMVPRLPEADGSNTSSSAFDSDSGSDPDNVSEALDGDIRMFIDFIIRKINASQLKLDDSERRLQDLPLQMDHLQGVCSRAVGDHCGHLRATAASALREAEGLQLYLPDLEQLITEERQTVSQFNVLLQAFADSQAALQAGHVDEAQRLFDQAKALLAQHAGVTS